MGVPKPVECMTKHLTKAEIKARKEQEKILKGKNDKLKPSAHLSKEQKKIFKYIVNELEISGILCNLDIYCLDSISIAIDRLQNIETMINADSSLLLNSKLMSAKDRYQKDFNKMCGELSLSPQARAKLGNLNIQSQLNKEDPLLKALNDE